MDVVTSITEVYTGVATWFIQTFNLVPSIFYSDESGLTFVGVIALIGSGIGIITGLIMLIRSWVKHR